MKKFVMQMDLKFWMKLGIYGFLRNLIEDMWNQ